MKDKYVNFYKTSKYDMTQKKIRYDTKKYEHNTDIWIVRSSAIRDVSRWGNDDTKSKLKLLNKNEEDKILTSQTHVSYQDYQCWTLVDFDDTKTLMLYFLIKLNKCFRMSIKIPKRIFTNELLRLISSGQIRIPI